MLIVELNATAGSGKTTLANHVYSQLKEKGIATATSADLVRPIKAYNLPIRTLMLIPIILHPGRVGLTLRVLRFCLDYGSDAYRLFKVKNLIEMDYFIDKIIDENLFDVLQLDEGIVQYLHYLPNEKLMKINENTVKVMDYFTSKYEGNVLVNCSITPETNLARLNKRGTVKRRYAQNTPEQRQKRRERLEARRQNLTTLRNNFKANPRIEIDMENDIDYNAEKIVSYITGICR